MNKQREKLTPGRLFSVPLRGGGFAHGYITSASQGIMLLCNIYDCLTPTEKAPSNLESLPLVLENLRISGAEFSIRPAHSDRLGRRWIVSDSVLSSTPAPSSMLFLKGGAGSEIVTDISGAQADRPPTPVDLESLPRLGADLPPVTTHRIEMALRRIEGNPFRFDPKMK